MLERLTRIRRINLQMHVKMKIHDKINFETRRHNVTPLQTPTCPAELALVRRDVPYQ